MAILLSALKTKFTLRMRDVSDVSDDLFYYWTSNVASECYERLLGCDSAQFLSSQAYTAITGSQALPADFGSVSYSGCGVWVKDADGTQTDTGLTVTNFGNQTRGYYIEQGYIYFTGMDNSESVVLRYTPESTVYTAMTQYVTIGGLITGKAIVPDTSVELLVAGLCYQYALWDQSGADGAEAQRFNALLDDLSGNFRQTPQAYATFDPTDNY